MAEKGRFSRALYQEWKQDPEGAAQRWGINWSEWESSMGKRDWRNMSYDQFEELLKKSRWSGLWDWTP